MAVLLGDSELQKMIRLAHTAVNVIAELAAGRPVY